MDQAMSLAPATTADETRTTRKRVLGVLEHAGYQRIEPAILQPASVFLDLAGEDIRGRIFLTQDGSGAEFCLRPEYTIPVCLAYLASPQAGHVRAFAYAGPVFRLRQEGSGEFEQAGVESFGRTDTEAADADCLAVTLEAAREAGLSQPQVRFGDTAILTRLLDLMALPAPWLRRLKRGLARNLPLDEIFADRTPSVARDHSGVLAALEGVDRKGARALVEDLLSIAGIASVGGRSPGEIAERFLEQSASRAHGGLSEEKRAVLSRFLAIAGEPDDASARLRALADEASLDLSEVLDTFDMRTGFFAANGIDLSALTFATAFSRNLDYYTGFVFEARHPGRTDPRPAIGGGRYDTLLRTLGASSDIPAVGAAIWLDRLSADASEASS